ncbi:MAG: hypothetical protein ACI9YB_003386 [Halioglobus sp.]|jgi:hypothetical protein
MTLSNKLLKVFSLDEGMLPGIYFENLESNEVVTIYNYLRDYSKSLNSNYTVWSNRLEQDLSINSLDNPASLVITNEICQFCHPLFNFSNDKIFVDNVSIYVFSDSIEIFYDVRDINSECEIENILKLVKKITSMSSGCVPFFGKELGEPREEIYQSALREYLKE